MNVVHLGGNADESTKYIKRGNYESQSENRL